MTGLAQGVTSLGLNYLTQKLNLNPLLANIGYSAIAGAIEGAFGITQYEPITNTYDSVKDYGDVVR